MRLNLSMFSVTLPSSAWHQKAFDYIAELQAKETRNVSVGDVFQLEYRVNFTAFSFGPGTQTVAVQCLLHYCTAKDSFDCDKVRIYWVW